MLLLSGCFDYQNLKGNVEENKGTYIAPSDLLETLLCAQFFPSSGIKLININITNKCDSPVCSLEYLLEYIHCVAYL